MAKSLVAQIADEQSFDGATYSGGNYTIKTYDD